VDQQANFEAHAGNYTYLRHQFRPQQLHEVKVPMVVCRHLQLKVVLGEGVWGSHDPCVAHNDVQPLIPQAVHKFLDGGQVGEVQLQCRDSFLQRPL
jgi:hypothetical protein